MAGVWIVSLKSSADDAAPAEVDERAPLLGSEYSEEPVMDEEMIEAASVQSDTEEDVTKRWLRSIIGDEGRPRGFSIGIGASSPGTPSVSFLTIVRF